VIQLDRLNLQTPRFVSLRIRQITVVLLSSATRIPEIVDGIYSTTCILIRIKRRLWISEGARRLMKPNENQTCLFPHPSEFQFDLTDKITRFSRAHASSLLDRASRYSCTPATPGRRRDASRRYVRMITWNGWARMYSDNVRYIDVARALSSRHHRRCSSAIRVSLLNRIEKACAGSSQNCRILFIIGTISLSSNLNIEILQRFRNK